MPLFGGNDNGYEMASKGLTDSPPLSSGYYPNALTQETSNRYSPNPLTRRLRVAIS